MKRNAFALTIREEKEGEFRRMLGQKWDDITELLDRMQADNFSLWQMGQQVFGYCETPDGEVCADAIKAAAEIADEFSGCAEWIAKPADGMRLMYHDFGIVRKNKELIRHRVFATKLREDFQEEYKRRHDGLIAARGGKTDPGPDSNFSIWNAGRYIFGYDEIDVTMETPEMKEEHDQTVKWENGMLEIMEWITDDVDWLTGERHPHVIRLASHSLNCIQTAN
ncbi:MAG: L-rhamnose mutarotase [Lachnospiraceae bacterium]|jgi:L-rhamnose mutarotase|nr:L-rhamnose mutarotase [Lachnospiraceae bacterium]MCH4030602.1 L-rhamnose mutarotase [Lachnospiraceae bacterium]MCH4069811.1 L-rhamnose mutarotase [Lachnospiraceae bacterium]MCH4107250.1 L-rhamnose mutarotase [Lachnospiraceae bacterium]MCI1301895.1 L-rhamnose mutarotase [Lachnospiraceae bacterium]